MTEAVAHSEKSKEELIESFHRARGALFIVLEGLTEGSFGEEAFDGWSLRNIVGHIIAWDERFISDARWLIEGEEIETGHLEDMDLFNAEVVENFRDIPVKELLRRLRESSRKVQSFLKETSQADLLRTNGQKLDGEKVSAGWMMDYSDHDLEHVRQISNWREELENGQKH